MILLFFDCLALLSILGYDNHLTLLSELQMRLKPTKIILLGVAGLALLLLPRRSSRLDGTRIFVKPPVKPPALLNSNPEHSTNQQALSTDHPHDAR